jgi:hypothetical protein
MKKTIILNESNFKKIVSLMEIAINGKSQSFIDHQNLLKKYRELGNDYFKNPNLADTSDSIAYNESLKKEMDEVVDTIYSVYEKITHGGKSNVFDGPATNGRPSLTDFGGDKVKWMDAIRAYNSAKNSAPTGKTTPFYPGTYYVEDNITKYSSKNKADFIYQTRCYYTMIMRIYENGEPVWANLFFNPKYANAKKAFFNCKQIAEGTLARISAGVADNDGNYPEGTINWIRKKKYDSAVSFGNNDVQFTPLEHDIVPLTYNNKQYAEFMPVKEQNEIINWFKTAVKNPQMYEKYLIGNKPKPTISKAGSRFGKRQFIQRR